MGATLAEVLRTFGPAYLRDHSLSTPQARAWRAIVACRTPALGGKLQRCDRCGREQRLFRSCRNRHCPQCQSHARDAWRQARWPSCCRCRTATWSSRCRTSSTTWRSSMRAGCTTR